MKNLIIILAFIGIMISSSIFAQTCPSTYTYQSKNSTGDWFPENTSNWNTAPSYSNTSSYVYQGTTYTNCVIIPASDVVQIIASNFYLANANLVIEGSLTFNGGKLNLDHGFKLIIPTGGL